MADSEGMTSVVERLEEEAQENDCVSVGGVMKAFGHRSFGPLIMLLGLLSLLPVGSIPGASVIIGTLVLLLCGQMLLGRDHPWVPGRIARLEVKSKRVTAATKRLKPVTGRIDHATEPRLGALVRPPWVHLAAVLCALNALLMFPLALVPWGVVPPSAFHTLAGLGLTRGDGLIVAISLVVGIGAVGFAAYWLLF